MANTIFDKILFGLKVANDNIVVLNEKVEKIMSILSEETKDEHKEQLLRNED